MWNELLTNELRECTSVDVFKKRLKRIFSIFILNSYSSFHSHNLQSFYFVIVDMYIFIVIVFL